MKWLLLLMVAALLNACSDDSEEPKVPSVHFEAQPCTQGFIEESAESMSGRSTRTGEAAWAPEGYYLYNSDKLYEHFKEQKDLMDKSIDVFFTQNDPFTEDNKNYMEGAFSFRKSTEKWTFSSDIARAGTYYLYGFIPQEVAASASVVGNSTFSEGAVLTINGMKTVTKSDVCVIVGAIDGTESVAIGSNNPSDTYGKSLTTGQFAVHANAATKESGTEGNNYIYLLFDHLYTSLRFSFAVHETYDAIRTIKLTKLELRAFKDDQETTAKAMYNAVIRLKATDDGSSPIQSVTFTPIETSADSPYETLYENDETGLELKRRPLTGEVVVTGDEEFGYTDFLGCFVPGETTYFRLRSTYDVLDKKGNTVRKHCVAENTIDIRNMFKIFTLDRGHMYSLKVLVQPTYLYVLSEPDMDNPTLTITK